MTLKRLSCLLALGACAVAMGCSKDTDGETVTPTIVAGLRYVNIVPDTGGMDIRVIDVIGDAPNTVNALFRTGGAPYGTPITGLPQHTAVLAGARHIRAFMSSTDPAIASIVMLDTTFTFEANTNYTVYLYRGTPAIGALIVKDSVPAVPNGKFAVRVLNLATTYAGAPVPVVPAAGSGADIRIASVIAGTPTGTTSSATLAYFANVPFGTLSPYVTTLDTSGAAATAAPYRIYVTANGVGAPALLQGTLPIGARGTAVAQPVPGTMDSGTAITAVIVPRSSAGSTAPQTTVANVTTNILSVARSNDTVTVTRAITPGNGTSTCNSAVATGAAVGDYVIVSGLAEAEYNGGQTIFSVTAGVNQTLDTARQIVTLTAPGVGSTYRLRFLNDTSAAIASDETPAALRAVLGAMPGVGGIANVRVTGPNGGPYAVTFVGSFLGTNPVSTMTVIQPTGVTVGVAVNFNCFGTATSARYRYRILGTPTTPATGTPAFKVVTPTTEYQAPNVLFIFDRLPARTAP